MQQLIDVYLGLLETREKFEQNEVILDYKDCLNQISKLEEEIKEHAKLNKQGYDDARIQVVYQERFRVKYDWNFDLIEKQDWANVVLSKAVDEQKFNALVKSKIIAEPEEFWKTEKNLMQAVYIKLKNHTVNPA